MRQFANAGKVASVLFVHRVRTIATPCAEPTLRVEVMNGTNDVIEWIPGGLFGEIIFQTFNEIHFETEENFDFSPVLKSQIENALDVVVEFAFFHADVCAVAVGQGIVIGGHEMARLIESLPISFGEEAVVRVKSITVLETPLSYVVTACFSIVVSALASYSPARRAARLRPIEILRA